MPKVGRPKRNETDRRSELLNFARHRGEADAAYALAARRGESLSDLLRRALKQLGGAMTRNMTTKTPEKCPDAFDPRTNETPEQRATHAGGVAAMTPRQVREAIGMIDGQLGRLIPWHASLEQTRQRYLLEAGDGSSNVLALLEDGMRQGGGRPPDPALAGFDVGLPGLRVLRSEIAMLRERRQLLDSQLPSKAATAAARREATAQAAQVETLAHDLDARTTGVLAQLSAAAQDALALTEDTRRMWEANVRLDRFCADEAIDRPDTPHRDAPRVEAATALASLLFAHFSGGKPYPVDESIFRLLQCKAHL